MAFAFEIRPINIRVGFYLECDGILEGSVQHSRLIDAILHAAQLGRDLDGRIVIYDSKGLISEVLPLPFTGKAPRFAQPSLHLHENHH